MNGSDQATLEQAVSSLSETCGQAIQNIESLMRSTPINSQQRVDLTCDLLRISQILRTQLERLVMESTATVFHSATLGETTSSSSITSPETTIPSP